VFALSLDSLFSLAPGGEENRAGKKTCQEQLISSGKIKATVSGPSSQSTGKELLSTSNQNTAWLDSHSCNTSPLSFSKTPPWRFLHTTVHVAPLWPRVHTWS